MCENIPITYTKCGFCTARNHCGACGAELSQALAGKEGILQATVNMAAKMLEITYSMDRDALEDMLDGMGIMTD